MRLLDYVLFLRKKKTGFAVTLLSARACVCVFLFTLSYSIQLNHFYEYIMNRAGPRHVGAPGKVNNLAPRAG